jgi:pSer/pThr/pTyr-binding forkhead associated (FHA) protein
VWIKDRGSTNGSSLTRDGVSAPLPPGEMVYLSPGDTVWFGRRSIRVEAVSRR